MEENKTFSHHLIKGLTDSTYAKRKQAALEIERLVRENDKSPERVNEIIESLIQDFIYSNNPNARNGGIISIAACAIALGPAVGSYLGKMVPPILSCFNHPDSRVRYYACESMYNISKIARGEMLRYFNGLFDALSNLVTDTESSVIRGEELLEKLIKDIVCEVSDTYVSPYDAKATKLFQLSTFIPLLNKKIWSHNPFIREYVLRWIQVLLELPRHELMLYLPDYLDGYIECLSDTSRDVQISAKHSLNKMLSYIKKAHQEGHGDLETIESIEGGLVLPIEENMIQNTEEGEGEEVNEKQIAQGDEEKKLEKEKDDEVVQEEEETINAEGEKQVVKEEQVVIEEEEEKQLDYNKIIDILIRKLTQKSTDEQIQVTVLNWLNTFMEIDPDVFIPFTPRVLAAYLPLLAVPNITKATNALNNSLMRLILELPPSTKMVSPDGPSRSDAVSSTVSSSRSSPNKSEETVAAKKEEEVEVKEEEKEEKEEEEPFDYQATVANLRLQFLNSHEETRVASLEWLIMLHKKVPSEILKPDDGTFPVLLKTLSDTSEEVVIRDLQLLAQISSHSDSSFFQKFMTDLLSLFTSDRRLLEQRGSLIVRQLCLSLDPEKIYCTIADIIEDDDDLEFASIMVQNMNIILITSSELAGLRKRLRNLESKDGQRLFTILYKCWSHNSVSALLLCLLAQAYEHACNMLPVFAELEMTVNTLIQLDKLVQLLESPIFTYLRLQLLEADKYPYLFKCLYGILMLLPQSSAFSTLRNRLNSITSLGTLQIIPKSTPSADPPKRQTSKSIFGKSNEETRTVKFQELLLHFKMVQSKHERLRKQTHQNHIGNRRRSRHGSGMVIAIDKNTGSSSNTSPADASAPFTRTSIPGNFTSRIMKRKQKYNVT
ncbi:ARM repeat-containing protein [Backusella circina FSU 941]|nr:ARM repeat-containing protein [Backusella circina FSU 941]